MINDARGSVVYSVSSNRAGYASDALIDNNLLAASATKTINVVAVDDLTTKPKVPDGRGNLVVDNTAAATTTPRPAIAASVWIKNSSGVRAEITLVVARDDAGKLREVARNPIHLESGEEITIHERVVQVMEKNIAIMTQQSGLGVRYYFTLEPDHRH